MGYTALDRMRLLNEENYHIANSVSVPPLPEAKRNYGREALSFIRENCEELRFDTQNPLRASLCDSEGRSAGKNLIPYNMEKDLDRLSLETAVVRFLSSGSREDAFDIYFCYCEMFQPFGAGYNSTGLLLELLSEHESNASSLLMKHRDHYSHSVYVFLLGLALYRNVPALREAYNEKYGLPDGKESAAHFIEYWGLTSLFHDIGYPFEIAHQQMKAYVCKLDKNNNDERGFSPYVSYKNMEVFCASDLGDLNDLFAKAIIERLSTSYLPHTGIENTEAEVLLKEALHDRAVHENPNDKDYLYMDHAYFSGLMLAKTYLDHHDKIEKPVMDAFCAVILHNSLFKFTLRSLLHTKRTLSLSDGQPLSYLLMFCDELQCWDRTSYGQNSRSSVYAFDFDMTFSMGVPFFTYYFDKAYKDEALSSKAYRDFLSTGYTKKSGAVREKRCKFLDDIDEIVTLRDLLPAFQPDVSRPDPKRKLKVVMEAKKKKTGLYLSDSNYLNLYRFAIALNGRYAGVSEEDDMKKAFEENLSLEYKLSNIAQAKGFAAQLHSIGCFYTDRAVDYAPVRDFRELSARRGYKNCLTKISVAEHIRWCKEKLSMGWQYGNAHVNAMTKPDGSKANDPVLRERTRMHHDLIDFTDLGALERFKDSNPMERMIELIRQYNGLTIYRMK